MKVFIDFFKPVPPDEARRNQLLEAERELVAHRAAAEMYIGMCGVYTARVERLRRELDIPPNSQSLRVAK